MADKNSKNDEIDADNEGKNVESAAVELVSERLLKTLLEQIRFMKEPWPALTKDNQEIVIDQLRNCVRNNVATAVRMIAADERAVIDGTIDSITVKDGYKVVIKVSRGAPDIDDLIASAGEGVLIVVSSAGKYMKDIDKIKGEEDQGKLNLGDTMVSLEEFESALETDKLLAAREQEMFEKDSSDPADLPIEPHAVPLGALREKKRGRK